MRFLRDITLVVLVLAGAVGFSQIPRFVQEYEQRLGGALDELRRQLAVYEGLAQAENLSFDALLDRLGRSAERPVAGIGGAIRVQAERAAGLETQAEALAAAGRLEKPLVLLTRHDEALLAATWSRFGYTLTLDPAFTVLGALAGIMVNALVWALLGGLFRLVSGRRGAAAR